MCCGFYGYMLSQLTYTAFFLGPELSCIRFVRQSTVSIRDLPIEEQSSREDESQSQEG